MTNRLANRNREERAPRVSLTAALQNPEAALEHLHADDTE